MQDTTINILLVLAGINLLCFGCTIAVIRRAFARQADLVKSHEKVRELEEKLKKATPPSTEFVYATEQTFLTDNGFLECADWLAERAAHFRWGGWCHQEYNSRKRLISVWTDDPAQATMFKLTWGGA